MKCKFCAEEIKDEAVVCRFCGAAKRGSRWVEPAGLVAKNTVPGSFVIKSTGVFFVIAFFADVFNLLWGSEISLLGFKCTGFCFTAYSGVAAAVDLAVGLGFMLLRPFGYYAFWAATLLFCLVQGYHLFSGISGKTTLGARELSILNSYGIDAGLLSETTAMVYGVLILCWLGFAVYIYIRKSSFLTCPPNQLSSS